MFLGKVIRGDGIGKQLGYPTANLNVPLEHVANPDGIYAGKAYLAGKEFIAAVVIDRDVKKFEAHLIDYDGPEFYDQEVAVLVLDHVSDVRDLGGKDLLAKIASDVKKVKQILSQKV